MVPFVALAAALTMTATLCLVVDARDRRRNRRTRDWSSEATNSRLDIQTLHHHTLQGSTLSWATHRRAERTRRSGGQPRD